MFRQIVQVWKSDATLRELTLHPGLAGYARSWPGSTSACGTTSC